MEGLTNEATLSDLGIFRNGSPRYSKRCRIHNELHDSDGSTQIGSSYHRQRREVMNFRTTPTTLAILCLGTALAITEPAVLAPMQPAILPLFIALTAAILYRHFTKKQWYARLHSPDEMLYPTVGARQLMYLNRIEAARYRKKGFELRLLSKRHQRGPKP